MSRVGTERERVRERDRIPSRLCDGNTEPDAWLKLTNHEVMSWAEIKSPTHRAPGWLSQLSIQLLTSGSGHDFRVHKFEPHIRFCAGNVDPAWDSLSLPLPTCLFSLSLSLKKINKLYKNKRNRGIWMTQSVKLLTRAQVMFSPFVSPTSGSALTAQSLEPSLDSVSPSQLTLCPYPAPLSFSPSKINI